MPAETIAYALLAFLAGAQLALSWMRKENAKPMALVAVGMLAASALILFADQREAAAFANGSFFFFSAALAGGVFLKGKKEGGLSVVFFALAACCIAFYAGLPQTPGEKIEYAVGTGDLEECGRLGASLAGECQYIFAVKYLKPEVCYGIADQSARDVCIYEVVSATGEKSICRNIDNQILQSQCEMA